MTEKHHRSAVSLKQTVGKFIIRRLKEAGISHMFGVPGDYNLEFLEQVEADKELIWVGCCNELNASYAADGYARTAGLSALMTTYGVGELSALCGIAGAYAEHIPVVAISGAPPLAEIERNAFLHHSAADGNFNNMMICAQQFSVAHTRLTPQNVVGEIDRCLRACILQKRPVYLQLPSDISYITIGSPAIFKAIACSLTPSWNGSRQGCTRRLRSCCWSTQMLLASGWPRKSCRSRRH